MSDNKPLAILDGAWVEINGVEILVLIFPTERESPEQIKQIHEILSGFAFGGEFVLASRQSDGRILVVAPLSLRAKLQEKIDVGLQWTKVPIFPARSP